MKYPKRCAARPIVHCMVAAMLIVTLPMAPSHALMIGTEQLIEDSQPTSKSELREFFSRADVISQMQRLGIDANEAKLRIDSLTDEELRVIAGRLDELPAGEGAVETVVGAALLIFIILLLTDLLGLTDVFPFIRR